MYSAALHENNITVIYHNFIKKFFDEIDEVTIKFNESIAVDNNSINATQDQTEKSNVSLIVATNTDDEVVLCQADGIVKNKKDENEKSVTDLPSQDTTINDFFDDEPSPKKSKQFTFTESELPDSEETKEFLKSYPREITEPVSMQSETESESNSEDESNWCSQRRRKKTKPVTEVPIDKLPTRFITRQRVPNIYLVCKKNCLRMLQSNYLKSQENQMNEDIIRENLKRLKTDNTSKGKLYVRYVKPQRKYIKSKSFAYKNTKNTRSTRCLKNKIDGKNIKRSKPHNKSKKHKKNFKVTIKKPERKDTKSTLLSQNNNKNSTPASITATKTNTRRTRAMKNISDGRNAKNKSVALGNIKNDNKQTPMHKKQRSTLPAVEIRRSKRYQKNKDEDVMKAPVSIPKKSMHEQSTVYKISSTSSESPKNLKRSLIEDSEVPSLKRTRSQNIKVTNAATPVGVMMKTRHQDERGKIFVMWFLQIET